MRKTSDSSNSFSEERVQLPGRLEVVAERLLDHEPVPAALRATLADLLDERPDHRRRDGEVVDAVAARAEVLVDVCERPRDLGPAGVVAEVHVQVAHPLGEGVPDVLAERIAAVLLDGGLHVLAEFLVAALVRATPSTAKLRGRRWRKASE